MGKINSLLNERLKKAEHGSKMAALAEQSAKGNLTTFSGIFRIVELNDAEKAKIKEILAEYALDEENLEADLSHLISITSEVKGINHQAALLHGERIKKAHSILTRYRDGAFTAWLLTAYGNRQTPYNLMQYYEFCEALPKTLRPQIEAMPRQAIYTLASRKGPLEKKAHFIEKYKGETKAELLSQIRLDFPLDDRDLRKQNAGDAIIASFQKCLKGIKKNSTPLTEIQKETLSCMLSEMQELLCAHRR